MVKPEHPRHVVAIRWVAVIRSAVVVVRVELKNEASPNLTGGFFVDNALGKQADQAEPIGVRLVSV